MTSSQTSACTRKRVLVIPAAGSGQRFRELGKKYPKCILPVQGTPIIVQTISAFTQSYDHPVFDRVVVSTGSAEHKAQIEAVIDAARFDTPVSVVLVDVPDGVKPSPAISLAAACEEAIEQVGEDVDVTVFLSDILPARQHSVDQVVTMHADSWGVVLKKDGDFERWCMVEPTDDGQMRWHDKPSKQPPTNLAAVGVYRYSSAKCFVDCVDAEMSNEKWKTEELQFSTAAAIYQQLGHRMSAHIFDEDEFRDFGTLEEYLANKGVSRCRTFNRITDYGRTIVKSSKQYAKIRDEAVWMLHAPPAIAPYVPRVIRTDLQAGVVEMEKIRSNNLRDVALYLDSSYETWVEIFSAVNGYLSKTTATAVPSECNVQFWDSMYKKTVQRAQDVNFGTTHHSWLTGDFRKAIDMLRRGSPSEDPVVYYHGDLHFANMFYCFTYKDLHVIDPRGEMRGSSFYDIAKLAHSALGRYDYIDADLYTSPSRSDSKKAEFYDRGHENIERAFFDVVLKGMEADDIWLLYQLVASLFLSMIPLHSESREHQAMFYSEFERFVKMASTFAPIGV